MAYPQFQPLHPVHDVLATRRASDELGLHWPLHRRFTLADGRDEPLGCVRRPRWRGAVHLIALCVAVPALTLLIAMARDGRTRLGVAVYAVGLCAMLAASTTYHRWVHNLRARAAWRRVDHAMIFAAIAGSVTPIILLTVDSVRGIVLLVAVWSIAAFGAALKLGHWHRGDTVGSVLYAAVGVLGGIAIPALWSQAGAVPGLLFVASGALYGLGSWWFARSWPRLAPAVFSYHEVWHLLTVAAASTHFVAVWSIAV